MKIQQALTLVVMLVLAGCATPSDPTFMNNASAAINGGIVETQSGAAMTPGLQNRNRAHPFFGTPP